MGREQLDKDTSGLMMVAKNDKAQLSLSAQIKERTIEKGYLALVSGKVSPREGEIDAPIARHPKNRKNMAIVEGGRAARTLYRVRQYVDKYTLVEARIVTGRTHQIRVHFASIGHAVFGDEVYGRKSKILGRQFLHAYRLGFKLPVSGKQVEFEIGLPEDLEEALSKINVAKK